MNFTQPDAFFEITLKTTADGGRKGAICTPWFGCPVRIDDEYHDCRLLLDGRKLELGQTYQVPVKFLCPDQVLPKLTIGKSVTLWEGKNIAEGTVVEPSPV